MTIDINEVYRYLGYLNNSQMQPDSATDRMISEISREIMAECHPKYTSREFTIAELEDTSSSPVSLNTSTPAQGVTFGTDSVTDPLGCGEVTFNSRSLAKHLKDCDRLILFAATLGPEIDRIIRKYEVLSLAKASIAQAIGTAAIEAFADTRCAILRRNYGQIKSRFSPGYGDFSLTYQLDFDRILNMRNTLGITLNDALLMTPSKSITAVIGIPKSGDSLNDWRQNEH